MPCGLILIVDRLDSVLPSSSSNKSRAVSLTICYSEVIGSSRIGLDGPSSYKSFVCKHAHAPNFPIIGVILPFIFRLAPALV